VKEPLVHRPTPADRHADDGRRRARPLAVLTLLLAVLWLGTAAAQIDLTEFSAGDVIRADEVNANFRAVADVAESNQARLDAVASGTERVGPYDMTPSETTVTAATAGGTAYDFARGARGKSGLELIGTAGNSGGVFCFGAALDLPDGATIVEFAAVLADPDGSGTGSSVEAVLEERPWTDTRPDAVADLVGLTPAYSETATTDDALPATVDNAANEYRVVACLQGDAGFLGARVAYQGP
jgi:hypothetical protein